MTDAVERAIARAKAQNQQGGYTGGLGDAIAPHHTGGMDDDTTIRMPPGSRVNPRMQDDTYLGYRPIADMNAVNRLSGLNDIAPAQSNVDLTGVRAANLDDAQRDQLLDELLTNHNEHTAERRNLELERDQIAVENKRRFSNLGFWLAASGGGIFLLAVVTVLAVMIYGSLTGTKTFDGSVLSAFLNTFMEVLKTVLSVF